MIFTLHLYPFHCLSKHIHNLSEIWDVLEIQQPGNYRTCFIRYINGIRKTTSSSCNWTEITILFSFTKISIKAYSYWTRSKRHHQAEYFCLQQFFYNIKNQSDNQNHYYYSHPYAGFKDITNQTASCKCGQNKEKH